MAVCGTLNCETMCQIPPATPSTANNATPLVRIVVVIRPAVHCVSKALVSTKQISYLKTRHPAQHFPPSSQCPCRVARRSWLAARDWSCLFRDWRTTLLQSDSRSDVRTLIAIYARVNTTLQHYTNTYSASSFSIFDASFHSQCANFNFFLRTKSNSCFDDSRSKMRNNSRLISFSYGVKSLPSTPAHKTLENGSVERQWTYFVWWLSSRCRDWKTSFVAARTLCWVLTTDRSRLALQNWLKIARCTRWIAFWIWTPNSIRSRLLLVSIFER